MVARPRSLELYPFSQSRSRPSFLRQGLGGALAAGALFGLACHAEHQSGERSGALPEQGTPAWTAEPAPGEPHRVVGGAEEPQVGTNWSPPCGEPSLPISEVQGSEKTSPLVDELVTIEGIVVGDFQGREHGWSGFFIQSELPDADERTSDGVFVFQGDEGEEVSLGDRVRVTGVVQEYFGLTEVEADAVIACGPRPLPAPVPLVLPFDSIVDLEGKEGMLVQLEEVTVTDSYHLGKSGEVVISFGGRQYHPNSARSGDPSAADTRDENERGRIILDDGSSEHHATPIPYLSEDGTLRLGDTIGEVVGVLHYSFGEFRIQPIAPGELRFARKKARPNAPESLEGDIRVGILNALNYFTTLGERGASTLEELERQRAKLVSTILTMDVDVLGIMEVENKPEVVDELVEAVNSVAGRALYARVEEPTGTDGALGGDAIRSAMLYKPSRLVADSASKWDQSPIFERPPIAQTFIYQGQRFTVVAVHLKSKSGCPDDPEDANADFGNGCFNAHRVAQAGAILDFIERLKVEASEPDVVLVGDLNSYLEEDPVKVLEAGGLDNPLRTIPPEARYSYVFAGEAGLLDYVLTTPELSVVGATIWHINADEPPLLDYNQEFNPPALYRPDPYRSSDHDPVIVGISF